MFFWKIQLSFGTEKSLWKPGIGIFGGAVDNFSKRYWKEIKINFWSVVKDTTWFGCAAWNSHLELILPASQA